MRRGLAIALSLLFGWLLLLPAFAAPASSVPACCKRNGKHHCSTRMHAASNEVGLVSINEKCPCVPQATVAAQFEFYAPASAGVFCAGLVGEPALSAQAEAGYRVSHFRSRQKRGPPAAFLS